MKRVMVSAAIIASMFTAAAPLGAQPYGGWDANNFWRGAPAGPWERIGFLEQRINRGIQDGSLDRREAWRARSELQRIRREAWQMRRRDGGRMTAADNAALQARLDNLSRTLRWLRHNGR
jgi:hypothetical protein